MNHTVSLQLAGEIAHLLPERAVWWPHKDTVFIADPHFGKAATFRHSGIPVPEEAHRADLNRLSRMLHTTEATHLVILGDFLHARRGNNAATRTALQKWRSQWTGLRITLVVGNHDRHAGFPYDWLEMEWAEEPFPIPPFAACHNPETRADGFVLAGHLHPGVRIATASAPCFYLQQHRLILPAFGTFTGIHTVRAQSKEETLFVVGNDEIVALP